MNGGAPALALNERALRGALFPPHPLFHRALADDVMLDPLKHAAQALGAWLCLTLGAASGDAEHPPPGALVFVLIC